MLKEKLAQLVEGAIRELYPDSTGHDVIIDYPSDPVHGDYACNSALQLAKSLQTSPRAVAEALVAHLGKPDFIQTIEIAGPGFINFFVAPDVLIGNLRNILISEEAYGGNRSGNHQKVMVEYSSPNTNKPLHLGHARNNFLGMAVANLLEANGYEVTKSQIINDRGIHICKSMLAYDKWGRDTSPESLGEKGDHFVGNYYVKFAQAVKKDESLEDEARDMLKKCEENDPHVRN